MFRLSCVCKRALKGTCFAICLLWSLEAQSNFGTARLIYLPRYLLEIIGGIRDRKS